MPGTKILSAFLIMVPATILLTAEASLGEPAAEACKASPGGAAPKAMHWYYRINRATNKHCWYLGPVGIHTKSHSAVATATSEPATSRKLNAADADNALPAEATAEGSEPAAPPLDALRAQRSPQPSSMQTASAVPAQVLPAVPAATANPAAGDPRFGARWPENLPNAEETEQGEPATVGSTNAELAEASANSGGAAQASSGETALRYFSIAGIVLIPLLLAVGWIAKFSRRAHGSPLSEQLRAMVERLRPRRRREAFAATDFDAAAFDEAEFDEAPLRVAALDEGAFDAYEHAHDEAAFAGAAPPIGPALSGRRARTDRRARAVTDPAHDLKRSLTELMHDLRRAAEPEQPVRHARRSYDRADERVLSPSLQPAE
jgi:hypothetical protein